MPVEGIILLIIAGIIFLFFSYAVWSSVLENELRAALVLAISGLLLLIPCLAGLYFSAPGTVWPAWTVTGIYLTAGLVFLFPWNFPTNQKRQQPGSRIDERDIMFSRRLLVPGTEKFDEYYKRKPHHLPEDNKFRKKPGLLNEGTTYYDPLLFRAADASFDTVAAFHSIVDGPVNPNKIEISSGQATSFIRSWAKKLGAVDTGIALMKDYHWYSVIGRGDDYGKEAPLRHKFGITFTVEMDKRHIDSAPQAPAILETAQQYLESGEIAVQVALLIRKLGYDARAHIDGNYRVVAPLVACDAGLGEIGRMGLLMTPKAGPRIRISVVTTNMPLEATHSSYDQSVESFCDSCKKCAANCPANAIPFGEPENINGTHRWQINQEKCFTFWCQAGTDCGRCISVCPYSHPDNPFHNFVRYGIRKNPLFRKLALKMDDLIYGRKPKTKAFPKKF